MSAADHVTINLSYDPVDGEWTAHVTDDDEQYQGSFGSDTFESIMRRAYRWFVTRGFDTPAISMHAFRPPLPICEPDDTYSEDVLDLPRAGTEETYE